MCVEGGVGDEKLTFPMGEGGKHVCSVDNEKYDAVKDPHVSLFCQLGH